MQREDLKTKLGKHIYDYSPIPKDHIPDDVLQDIAQSFFIRNQITEYKFNIVKPDNIYIWEARTEPKLQLYTEWRTSFSDFGYEAPILEIS